MAVTDTHRTIALGTRLTGVLSILIGSIANWNDARKTRNTLGRLSDHELEDIGLCRGDIDQLNR